MNRGIVMEVQKQSVLVLTSEGEFVKCRKQHREYEIGEEVLFPQAERMERHNKLLFFFSPKRFALAVSSVLALCLFLIFYSPAKEKAMAYVAVDINPSLEITVDSKLHVMKLAACNEDGRRVLSELKTWEDEPLSTVIRAIVRQSQQDGYLKSDKQVTITSVTASGADEQMEQRIDDVITNVQKAYEKEAVTVVSQKSTMQMREDAKRAGVSTGIYTTKQKKERLQREQEENGELEQAPATSQETPKPETIQPSAPAEQQKETPSVPKSNSGNNTAPSPQSKTEKKEKEQNQGEKQRKEEKAKTFQKTENWNDRKDNQNQNDRKDNQNRNDRNDNQNRNDRNDNQNRNDRNDNQNRNDRNDNQNRNDRNDNQNRNDRRDNQSRNDRKDNKHD